MIDKPTCRLKIIFLVKDLLPSTVFNYASQIPKALKALGHAVSFYNLDSTEKRSSLNEIPIVSAKSMANFTDIYQSYKELQSFVNDQNPDVIQSHMGISDVFLAATSTSKNCLKVRAALSPRLYPHHPLFSFLFERAVSRLGFDHHIAATKSVASIFQSSGIAFEKITVINNPIAENIFGSINRQFEKTSPLSIVNEHRGLRIGYFGRFNSERGPDRAIWWFHQMLSKLPKDTHLFLGGFGKMESELKLIIKDRKIENDVTLLGSIKNPLEFLPYLNVVINPSRAEGLPVSLLEAAALGCSIIATRTDGSLELETLAPRLLLLPNEDRQAPYIIDNMAQWVADQKRGLEQEPNLTKEAKTKLDSNEIASRYLAVYNKQIEVKGAI